MSQDQLDDIHRRLTKLEYWNADSQQRRIELEACNQLAQDTQKTFRVLLGELLEALEDLKKQIRHKELEELEEIKELKDLKNQILRVFEPETQA